MDLEALGEEQQEAMRMQAAREGLSVEELMAKILLREALAMIDETGRRRLGETKTAVILPFRK